MAVDIILLASAADRHGRTRGLASAFEGRRVVVVEPELAPMAKRWVRVGTDGAVTVARLPSNGVEVVGQRWDAADVRASLEGLIGLADDLRLGRSAVIVQDAGWAHVAGAFRAVTDLPVVSDLARWDGVQGFLGRCNLVLARSRASLAGMRTLHWNVVLVPDGLDHAARTVAAPSRRSERPVVGYMGEGPLHGRLLALLAELRPGWTFVAATEPDPGDRDLLDTAPNVHVLDADAAALDAFAVGLLPLRATDRHPTEALAMLAAGLPVVATPHPDLEALQADGVAIGATPDELLHALDRALEAGVARAPVCTWDERAGRFAALLDSLVPLSIDDHTHMTQPLTDTQAHIADLEQELGDTRLDFQAKLRALTERAEAAAGTARPSPDVGLYELMLGLERQRAELYSLLHLEHNKRLEVEAELDRARALAAEAASLREQLHLEDNKRLEVEAELDRARALAAETASLRDQLAAAQRATQIAELRAHNLETSLAWRFGRTVVGWARRLPGAGMARRALSR